jgi:Leishmanolysin
VRLSAAVAISFSETEAVGQASITRREIDWYSFTAPQSGEYWLEALTPGSPLDPVIGLYSASGQRLSYNDDINDYNYDSRAGATLTAGRRYFLGITNYSGSSMGSYQWRVTLPQTSSEDSYENNDTRATAMALGEVASHLVLNNLVMADSADWFAFRTRSTGGTQSRVMIDFDHAQGDLDLELMSASGRRISLADGTTDREAVSLRNQPAGLYYVRVFGYNNTLNPRYQLSIVPPLGPLTDDSYEENDTQATARSLGTITDTLTLDSLVMADAADWYRFDLTRQPGTATIITAEFTHDLGDIDMELYNQQGTRVAYSDSASDGESLYLEQLPTGSYFLRTYGYRGVFNPTYRLQIIANDPIPDPPPTGSFQITLQMSGLTATQQAIFQQTTTRWSQIITGDIPDAMYNGIPVDDLLITARAISIDGPGGILGQAGPNRFRSGSGLPIHGIMEFDSADLAALQSAGQLQAVVLHEIGHILGIGTIWSNRGLLTGAGTSNPRFTGQRATAEYNQLFNRNDIGVPLESGGGAGTRDSHWSEFTFDNELMTGYLNGGRSNPLSRVTIASLGDLGYQVNMNAADLYVPPGRRLLGTPASSASASSLSALLRALQMEPLGSQAQRAADYHLEDSNIKVGGGIVQRPVTSAKHLVTDAFYSKYRGVRQR